MKAEARRADCAISAPSCTAPRSAPMRCWNARARASASSPRAGFRDVLEMRRRDRPQTWGLRGNFVPVVPRDLRLEVDERVLADGTLHTRSISTRCAPSARAAGARARRRWRLLHQRLCQRRQRAARRRGGARALAQRARRPRRRSCPRSASSSAARPPRSTPICSRWSAAISASSKPDCASEGFAGTVPHRADQRRRDVAAAASRFPVRTALSGPAAGVIAARRHRARGRFSRRDHRRHGRDVLRRVAGRRRRGRAGGADGDRFRHGDPLADDPDRDHRRRRRLDRPVDASGMLQVGPETAGSGRAPPATAGATCGRP